jgi:mycothiol system anti-sigma-R factor
VTGPEEGFQGGHSHAVPSPLDCSNALLRMFEYLDGEMSGADCQQIQAHLDECAECLRQYHIDQMVKFVVKRSCGSETAPVALRRTILQHLTVVRLDASDEAG